ncbi:MAG: rod-binding protein [Chloroflexi bacterium]|nr:rod-binding protein [Chloroflexota bacterium]
MNVLPLQTPLKAAHIPLEKLDSNPHLSEAEKIAEVSRQFEAVLLRQILAQARKTVFSSEFNSDSTTHGIYQDMINYQLAESISQTRTLGLARGLAEQFGRQASARPDGAAPHEAAARSVKSQPVQKP